MKLRSINEEEFKSQDWKIMLNRDPVAAPAEELQQVAGLECRRNMPPEE